MSLRTISGALKTASGAPYADEPVNISFYGPSGTPGVLWLTSHKTERTDADGVLSVDLYADEAGDEASFYRISVGEDSFEVTVPAGEGPLSWSELRERGLVNRDWTQETVAHFIENNPALRGPPGPSIDSSGIQLVIVHTQSAPAAEWSVPLPWGVKAGSVQLEVDGQIVIPDVVETSTERVVVVFPEPTTGTLTLIRGA